RPGVSPSLASLRWGVLNRASGDRQSRIALRALHLLAEAGTTAFGRRSGRRKHLKARSIDDVDGGVDAVTRAGGAHDGPDRLGDATPAADDAAEVVGRHVQPKHHTATAFLGLHHDGVGLVDDRAGDVGEHGAGRAALDAVAEVVVDVVVELVEVVAAIGHALSTAPEMRSSLATVSVGCGPLVSQAL